MKFLHSKSNWLSSSIHKTGKLITKVIRLISQKWDPASHRWRSGPSWQPQVSLPVLRSIRVSFELEWPLHQGYQITICNSNQSADQLLQGTDHYYRYWESTTILKVYRTQLQWNYFEKKCLINPTTNTSMLRINAGQRQPFFWNNCCWQQDSNLNLWIISIPTT